MTLVKQIIELVLSLLSAEQFKKVVDAMLDKIEDSVTESSNTIDDAIVLPLCKKVRDLLNVPDDDVS